MTMTRADFIRQAAEARKTMQELARLFPGCFHADGRAIVASAHLPRSESAPVCPWCERQGWDGCQHADEVKTCRHA